MIEINNDLPKPRHTSMAPPEPPLELCRLDPARTAFVDDRLVNVEAARVRGVHALQLLRRSGCAMRCARSRSCEGTPPARVASHLPEACP